MGILVLHMTYDTGPAMVPPMIDPKLFDDLAKRVAGNVLNNSANCNKHLLHGR